MNLQDKKAFIINCVFFVLLAGIVLFVLRELLPMFAPFVIGLVVAAVLSPLIHWISEKTKIKQNLISIAVLLVFFGLVAALLGYFGVRVVSVVKDMASRLPSLYTQVIEPEMSLLFQKIMESFPDHEEYIYMLFQSLESSIQDGIMKISTALISLGAAGIVGFPALVIQIVFTVIFSFFLTVDYDRMMNFILRQFKEERRQMLVDIGHSARIVIFKILRVYALMMTITFVELYIGFTILKIPMALLLAFLVAIVDILPILGTGTVLIPWGIILLVLGKTVLGAGILFLYLFITVVRQSLEPRVIGQQVGLHPIVTLLCIFAGAQLIGVLGIFTFPVIATIIKKMNDEGTIHLIK